MLTVSKIKTKTRQKGNLLFVKSHRTDKKPISGNYFGNILKPFIDNGLKVCAINTNPNTGFFNAVLITP